MQFAFVFVLFFTTLSFAQTNADRLQSLQVVKRVAFGSCNNEEWKQPLWKDLIKQKPDIFVWAGDTVYADWGKSAKLEASYKKQNAQPDYLQFKSQTPVIGTWDDHDFAYDNAGGNTSFKKFSQKVFLDFYEVPEDSPRRIQEGVYNSYEYGPEGQKVKFIMLDNRYFKGLEASAPLLGEVQWQWLEEEFKNSTASLHFITTGLPVFSPAIPYTEEWSHYPREYNRMLNLLKTYNPKGVIFLVGDKHFGSIYKRSGQLEFMSSGMTHTVPTTAARWYLNRKYSNTFFGLNYGQIDIAWEETIPKLKLSIRNSSGKDIIKRNVKWKTNQWVFI